MQSIKKYLTDNSLSYEQLAQSLGVSRVHVTKMIGGNRAPSVKLLRKMHEVTGIPVKTLLYECT